MRMTIIKDDSVVGINGYFKAANLTTLEAGIRVVQWDESIGHVEYYEGANRELDSVSEFQSFIDAWGLPLVIPSLAKLSRRQAFRVLYETGMTAAVEAIVAGLPGVDGDKARIDWKEFTEVWRDHPLIPAVVGLMGVPADQIDAQVDAMFTLGATL